MAGTYIRCDIDCKPRPTQPKEAIVNQAVSAIEYEVFNNDYVRKDIDNGATTQPQLLDGWNDDFIRVVVDGTKTTGLSQKFVEQSLYKKHDIENNVVPFQAYVRRDVNNDIVSTFYIEKTDPTIIGLLADEDDRDNIIMSENDLFRIQLEDNTRISHIDIENEAIFTDEQSVNNLLLETGQFISQQDP